MSNGVEPWHMWGNSQTFAMATTAVGVPTDYRNPQLAKVGYRRPESWRFFFFCTLSGLQDAAPFGALIQINFSLIIGIGRSSVNLPRFVQMTHTTSAPLPPDGLQLYTSVAREPPLFSGDTSVRNLDQIVAQDIQLSASVQLTPSAGVLTACVAEVGAFFAPNVHVRPDWFTRVGAFRGKEENGS